MKLTPAVQKILSNYGHASRRKAEELILEGRVSVNGQVRDQPGARADPETDEITVDGVLVNRNASRYFMLNKPEGVVTSASDELGRETVLDLVPIGDIVLHPVGRLDADSQGLIILTNDGNLTQLLTHPSHQVEKEYLLAINMPLARADLQRLVRGVKDGGETLRAASVRETHPTEPQPAGDAPAAGAWLLITLLEGRNREIRRMMSALGREVVFLQRVRIGPLALGTLGNGAFRELSDAEVERLYEAAKQPAARTPPR